MIYASWSRRRRRNRQESLGSPARKRKGGLDQVWWMESARPMRRKTRKKMANRSECWGLWVLPVSARGRERNCFSRAGVHWS